MLIGELQEKVGESDENDVNFDNDNGSFVGGYEAEVPDNHDAHSLLGAASLAPIGETNIGVPNTAPPEADKEEVVFRRVKISECCQSIERTFGSAIETGAEVPFEDLYRTLPLNHERGKKLVCGRIVLLALLHLCNKNIVTIEEMEDEAIIIKGTGS